MVASRKTKKAKPSLRRRKKKRRVSKRRARKSSTRKKKANKKISSKPPQSNASNHSYDSNHSLIKDKLELGSDAKPNEIEKALLENTEVLDCLSNQDPSDPRWVDFFVGKVISVAKTLRGKSRKKVSFVEKAQVKQPEEVHQLTTDMVDEKLPDSESLQESLTGASLPESPQMSEIFKLLQAYQLTESDTEESIALKSKSIADQDRALLLGIDLDRDSLSCFPWVGAVIKILHSS